MKKIIMILAVLMGVSTAYANKSLNDLELGAKIEEVNELKFKVSLVNVSEDARILILDAQGHTLYKEFATATGSYVKLFNLTELANGKYTFVIENGEDKIEKELTISTEVKRVSSLK